MRDQIAKLAEASRPFCVPDGAAADEDGDTYCRHCGIGMNVEKVRPCGTQPNPAKDILAEFDRLSKIEAAAREVSLYAKAMQEAMRQVRSSAGRGESAMFAAQDRAVELQERYAASLDALDAALNAKGQP